MECEGGGVMSVPEKTVPVRVRVPTAGWRYVEGHLAEGAHGEPVFVIGGQASPADLIFGNSLPGPTRPRYGIRSTRINAYTLARATPMSSLWTPVTLPFATCLMTNPSGTVTDPSHWNSRDRTVHRFPGSHGT